MRVPLVLQQVEALGSDSSHYNVSVQASRGLRIPFVVAAGTPTKVCMCVGVEKDACSFVVVVVVAEG